MYCKYVSNGHFEGPVLEGMSQRCWLPFLARSPCVTLKVQGVKFRNLVTQKEILTGTI
jgi:hypothetical protein